jgi:putative transposase
MKSGRFGEERIIGILKRQEAGQRVADLAREHGISEAMIYNWKSKYGGLEVNEGAAVAASRRREPPVEAPGCGP